MVTIASNTTADRAALVEFLRPRHKVLFGTFRRDGRVQLSPVSGGIDAEGRLVIATYPKRAKTANARRETKALAVVVSDDWNGAWVQLEGTVEVLDMPAALEPLVDYFRAISGEHSDWDDYRAAMVRQDKSLLRLTIGNWGPIATGGFPPELAG